MPGETVPKRVLVTGSAGYVGKLVTRALLAHPDMGSVLATDIQEKPSELISEKLGFPSLDIRSSSLASAMAEESIDVAVHLAAIVSPPKGMSREEVRSIDVGGTEKLLDARVAAGVKKIIVTSSGAAYGHFRDTPDLLREEHPLRGNPEFAYSDHKRLVEEMLARYCEEHAQLAQLIFRPGTILGEDVSNKITVIFQKPVILGLKESASPFALTWDQDVVQCIL